MGISRWLLAIVLAAGAYGQTVAPRGVIGGLSAEPLLSPSDVAGLEVKLSAQPDDLDSRSRLLNWYATTAPQPGFDDVARRQARLRHILYFIERQPQHGLHQAPPMYVYGVQGPWANAADHDQAKQAWITQMRTSSASETVIVNAARFLCKEDPELAESELRQALARQPESKAVAAQLGFLYARAVIKVDSMQGERLPRAQEQRDALRSRALNELAREQNPAVLAAAAMALPELHIVSGGAPADTSAFQLCEQLMARARDLGRGQPEFAGPMPMAEFLQAERVGQRSPARIARATDLPSQRIRVGGEVQAAKATEKPDPIYPPLAMQARIQGDVTFSAVIGKDGSVQELKLQSGHPLLVQAAEQAAKQWRYQPTSLNGTPVEIATELRVSFRMP